MHKKILRSSIGDFTADLRPDVAQARCLEPEVNSTRRTAGQVLRVATRPCTGRATRGSDWHWRSASPAEIGCQETGALKLFGAWLTFNALLRASPG